MHNSTHMYHAPSLYVMSKKDLEHAKRDLEIYRHIKAIKGGLLHTFALRNRTDGFCFPALFLRKNSGCKTPLGRGAPQRNTRSAVYHTS